MQLARWEPVARLGSLHSMFSDLFDGHFDRPLRQTSQSTWYPAVDVLESKDSYLVRAELPGMKKEDIKVEVKDGTLTISGESKSEKPADGVEYRHVERVATKFWRSFSLPEIAKQDGIEAVYKDGILEIRVPKAEEAKPRQIEVSMH